MNLVTQINIIKKLENGEYDNLNGDEINYIQRNHLTNYLFNNLVSVNKQINEYQLAHIQKKKKKWFNFCCEI